MHWCWIFCLHHFATHYIWIQFWCDTLFCTYYVRNIISLQIKLSNDKWPKNLDFVAAHIRSYLPLLLYNLAKPLVNEDVDIVRKHSQLLEVLFRQLECACRPPRAPQQTVWAVVGVLSWASLRTGLSWRLCGSGSGTSARSGQASRPPSSSTSQLWSACPAVHTRCTSPQCLAVPNGSEMDRTFGAGHSGIHLHSASPPRLLC